MVVSRLHERERGPHHQFGGEDADQDRAERSHKGTGKLPAVHSPRRGQRPPPYGTGFPVGASPAQFGALDAIDDIDVVRALLAAAEDWLRARGAERVSGPFSPSINSECGLLVEGHQATPMFLMPWHPAYLGRHLDALGYEKARDLISYRWGVADKKLDEKPRFSLRKEWNERLKVRTIDMSRLKTQETPIMTELFNDAWRGNWGYVP